jgi:hypothetical protein
MLPTTASDATAARPPGPGRGGGWKDVARSDIAVVLALTVVCFVTRLMALPASLWEWDDILFANALHRYDLPAHHPHPPGFPVFVMMARAAYAITGSEHLGLAVVSVAFASLIAGALFYVFRQVFEDRAVAVAGAVIGSFLPSVWVHSGAGRSDEPGFALGLIGLALALHGLRSRRSLLLACALLGLAAGVRITLIVSLGPAVAVVLGTWLWRRQWRLVATGVLLGVAGALAWYVPLVLHTTPEVYRAVMAAHAEFAWKTDSIVAETENGILSYRLARFFGDVWGHPWIMWTMYGLSAAGVAGLAWERKWRAIAWLAVAFLPFMGFTLVLNTPLSAPLYALPYLPLFVGLAAWGLVWLPRRVCSGYSPALAASGLPLAFGLTAGLVLWSYPVVAMLRGEESPPIRAIRYLDSAIEREKDVLSFDGLFTPHVGFFLPDVKAARRADDLVVDANLIDPGDATGRVFALTTDRVMTPGTEAFRWSSRRGAERLRTVSLGRYMEAYVTDARGVDTVQFLDGWYQQEWDERRTWRWMTGRGTVALLNVAEAMTLHVRAVPLAIPGFDRRPTITVRLDGKEVDRFVAEGPEIDRFWRLEPDPRRLWSVLTLETDQPVTPRKAGMGEDVRELGMQCFVLRWFPASGAETTALSRFLGDGWHPFEREGSDAWRWTGERATVHLPPVDADAELDLTVFVPPNDQEIAPRVRFERNGQVLDSFQVPFGTSTHRFRVAAETHEGQRLELVLWGITTPSAGDDHGAVAMRVHHLGWRMVRTP